MGYDLPARVPAWRVECYDRSTLAAHWKVGRMRTESSKEDDRTFRSQEAAEDYAERKSGLASFLVPWIFRECEIVATSRKPDWRDKFRAALNMRPFCGGFSKLYDTRIDA